MVPDDKKSPVTNSILNYRKIAGSMTYYKSGNKCENGYFAKTHFTTDLWYDIDHASSHTLAAR